MSRSQAIVAAFDWLLARMSVSHIASAEDLEGLHCRRDQRSRRSSSAPALCGRHPTAATATHVPSLGTIVFTSDPMAMLYSYVLAMTDACRICPGGLEEATDPPAPPAFALPSEVLMISLARDGLGFSFGARTSRTHPFGTSMKKDRVINRVYASIFDRLRPLVYEHRGCDRRRLLQAIPVRHRPELAQTRNCPRRLSYRCFAAFEQFSSGQQTVCGSVPMNASGKRRSVGRSAPERIINV